MGEGRKRGGRGLRDGGGPEDEGEDRGRRDVDEEGAGRRHDQRVLLVCLR